MGDSTEFIDLFSGAGGFSAGFEEAGFTAKAGIDIGDRILETFEENHQGEGLRHDISGETLEFNVDLVIGSPPCQGFSHAKGERSLEDVRNDLVFDFIRWVAELQPKVVVMENVAGITNISDDFIDLIREDYEDAGYRIKSRILNSANFGVPQKRRRYFVIGLHESLQTEPSFPAPTHTTKDSVQTQLNGEQQEVYNTVGDALVGLPAPTDDGEVEVEPMAENKFQEFIMDSQRTTNHIAKSPLDQDIEIVRKIPEGKMYRSSRFGDMYVQVWDLFSDKFSEEEQKALEFIARNRTRQEYKATSDSGPDYVPEEKIPVPEEVVRALHDSGWLRREEDYNGYDYAYDLNTKSGVRPKFIRLDRKGLSNTLLTRSFEPREKLHPTEHRALSLREGARIQSFPDSFHFVGDFKEVAVQIGNAVPPLIAYRIARHIREESWL